VKFTPTLQFGFKRPVPVVLQTEALECGLACVAMLVGYHGLDTDLWTLRQNHSVSLHGTTLKQITHIASALGFASRAVKLELEELQELQLPCILHRDLNHFVVLTQVARGHVRIHDPSSGQRRMTLAEVSQHFTGVALEMTPAEFFKPSRQRQECADRNFKRPH
jgi:ATP-binding cassette subfamily B protein RaxB